MTIILYGIRGVYNFGCEAIVRGAVRLIKNCCADTEIIYYSFSYDYDKAALKDLPLIIRPMPSKKTFLMRVENKAMTLLNMKKRVLYFDYEKVIEEGNIIFSIGGDIYTIPKVVRQAPRYSYYNQLVDFCNRAIEKEKSVVVYGASIGPFGVYQKAVAYYRDNLKRYRLILCREEETIKYLDQIGLNNTRFFPDPAFQVKLTSTFDCQSIKKYIAVNLSPLSVKEIYGKVDDAVCQRMAVLMDKIFDKYGLKLLFVPHVISKDVDDNDELFLKQIRSKMKYGDQTELADISGGFLGIKKQLRACFITVTARMHCAINSAVENVPPIFLSYSRKSIGMCEYIYGNRKWAIDLNRIESELLPTIDDMWKQKEALSEYLIQRNVDIEKDYAERLEGIRSFIS